YVAGMYLNDAFDREFDTRERPERPIPAGEVTATTVFGAGFAMMLMAIALLAIAGIIATGGSLWRAPAARAVLPAPHGFYNCHHKSNPLSPVVMGLCRVLVYITAALALTTGIPQRLWVAAAVALAYLIGLTYVAKQETLSRVETMWPLAFLAVPFLYGVPI